MSIRVIDEDEPKPGKPPKLKPKVRQRCKESGKVIFGSHQTAATRAGEVLQQAATAVKELRTYRCPACKGWHLTSQCA